MDALAPLGNDNRIADADNIRKTSESVYDVTRQIDQANEELDDLNEGLKILASKHEIYKIKVDRAKKLMRKLTTEL